MTSGQTVTWSDGQADRGTGGQNVGGSGGRRLLTGLAALTALAAFAVPASAQTGIAVGAKAPVVTVNDLDGKPVDFGQFIGKKAVFLQFWATWCPQCEELLPRVTAARAAVGDKVEFLGINVVVNQTPKRVRTYVDEHHPPFLTLYDDKGVSVRAYQAPGTAYIVIIDRTGKVAYTGLGADQQFEEALKKVAG